MREVQPKQFYDDYYRRRGFYVPKAFNQGAQLQALRLIEGYSRVLDIGCGSGWFGQQCIGAGHSYVGVDYSVEAVEAAREVVPEGVFYEIDMEEDQSIIREGEFDVIVLLSFLEHIKGDLKVLESIPLLKPVVFVVPSRLSKGHVRAFGSPEAIFNRYGGLIQFDEVLKVKHNRWIQWIVHGVRVSGDTEFDIVIQEVI